MPTNYQQALADRLGGSSGGVAGVGAADWSQVRGDPGLYNSIIADEAQRHGMTPEQWLPVREQTLQDQYQRDIASIGERKHDLKNKFYTSAALMASGAGAAAALGPASAVGGAAGGVTAPAVAAPVAATAAPAAGYSGLASIPGAAEFTVTAPAVAGGAGGAVAGGSAAAAPLINQGLQGPPESESGGSSVFDKIRQFSRLSGGGGGGGGETSTPESRRFSSPTPTVALMPRKQGPVMPSSTNYRQLYADAERQRAYADALLAQSMQPRGPSLQGQRIVPTMEAGQGIAQLGEALLARRAGKKAKTTETQAVEARRKAQAAALSGMDRAPNAVETPEAQNPYGRAQNALEAGVDPSVTKAYLAQQMPDQAGEGAASIQGYKVAKSEGYKGSYTDYKKEFEARSANTPSAWLEWEEFNKLPPEKKKEYIELKRSIPVENVNSIPTRVLPGGEQQPLSTLATEAEAKRRLAEAGAQGTAAVIPADTRTEAQVKMVRAKAAFRRLSRVSDAVEALADNMILKGGPLQSGALSMTQEGQELDQAVSQLQPEITALTRIPGVGSQSDLEQRLANLQMPSSNLYPEVNRRAIQELDAFLHDLDAAYENVSKGKPGNTAPGDVPSFATEQEAEAAAASGKLNKGSRVTIGGVSGTWQ